MRADGYRSGGVYCGGCQVVESCGCTLYCEPDDTAVLEGGDCAAGGGYDFGEFEETSTSLLLFTSRNITRPRRVYTDMRGRIADQERV